MRLLAIDPATVTGVADGLAGGTPMLTVIRLRTSPDDTAEDIFGRAGEWLWRRLVLGKPDVMAIEQPIPPARMKGKTNYQMTKISHGIYGTMIGIAKAAGVEVLPVHIASWRKCVLGKGNMPGADAKRAMMEQCRRLGWPTETHDGAEAAGIHIYASGIVLGRARAASSRVEEINTGIA